MTRGNPRQPVGGQWSYDRTIRPPPVGDMQMKLKTLIASAVAGTMLLAAAPAMSQQKLTVWWVKGFYKAEDDALFAAIKKFEDKHKGVKIELSQYPVQDMIPKT